MPEIFKWIVVAVLIVVIAAGIFFAYASLVTNARVADELRKNPDGERAGIVMLLTFPDGKQLPMNYLREGDRVFAGADGPWWRVFRGDGADVTMLIHGETLTGHARVVLDDPEYTHEMFARLRPKVPKWVPDWLNGKLVEITLNSSR